MTRSIGFLIFCLATNISDGRTNMLGNTNPLTGNMNKCWYLNLVTPESDQVTCKSSSSIKRDNTYTFFADGRFEFDHGQITEDPNCKDEGCCSDWVNIEGTWAFTNNGKGLKIVALRVKGTSTSLDNEVLFDASIDLLSEEVLRLKVVDPETKIRHSLEFRKK